MNLKHPTTPDVLIVDDSAVDRRLAADVVRQAGYTVNLASDGDDALGQISVRPPSVVVTDLRMPKLDGLQLVKRLREASPTIPVILMTGFGSEEIAAEALQAGAASYVPKQHLATDLPDVVRDVLASVPSERTSENTTEAEFHYELGYQREDLASLVSQLQSRLTQAGYEDETEFVRIAMALTEALNNAVEHGNLELDSELREDDGDAYAKLRDTRIQNSPYDKRRVQVTQKITPNQACFTIVDEGQGFDYLNLPDPTAPENLTKVHGRGMLLIRTFMDDVQFNDKGNEITMTKNIQLS